MVEYGNQLIRNRVAAVVLCVLSALLSLTEYSAARAVYVGHFGRSLEYDWAMLPWYWISFIVFSFAALMSGLTAVFYNQVSPKMRALSVYSSLGLFLLTLITAELILPYWYKHVQLLNYGRGG